ICISLLFTMLRRRAISTLFPYPTLFRSDDPLAALRKAAGAAAHEGPRALRLEAGVEGLQWSADSRQLALMLHSVDNKDRWLAVLDRKSTRLNSSHVKSSYAVFCLKKKTK